MFDTITFKAGSGFGPPIDVGALAEALIFYRRVIVVGTSGTLKHLLERVKPFIVLSLVRDGRLEFRYQHEQASVISQEILGGGYVHDLAKVSRARKTPESAIAETFRKSAGSTSQAKIGASQLLRLSKIVDYSLFNHRDLLYTLADEATTTRAIRQAITTCAPEYSIPSNLIFKLERGESLFRIDTNINFDDLNRSYHKRFSPSHSSMSVAHLLSMLQGMNEALHFSAAFESELSTSSTEQQLIMATVPTILNQRTSNDSNIARFLDLTLEGKHTLREAVNNGKVQFVEIARILESADRFKSWLQDQPPNAELVQRFYSATVADTWMEKLPTKTARWGIFTGAGLAIDALGAGGIGTVAGLALSSLDSLVLDKLIKGWKPHHFVQSELLPLVKMQ